MQEIKNPLELEAKHKVLKQLPKGTTFLAIINAMTKWYEDSQEFEKNSLFRMVNFPNNVML